MIDILIICSLDAVSFAESLARLLGAEQHKVRLSYGRQSVSEIESARFAKQAVLLIWSYDAPTQHYMLEWARNVDPTRLVEVARAPGAPRIERRAPIIDFTNWRGERGARAWTALNDRLRAVTRVLDPAKGPPKQAAMALGLASVAAVGGALFVRVDEAIQAPPPMEQEAHVSLSSEAVGGALEVFEPPTFEETIFVREYGRSLDAMPDSANLAEPAAPPILELRDPTILERLSSLNPLRRDS